jgi:RNA polymerase sigma factor (sigma-70 family)
VTAFLYAGREGAMAETSDDSFVRLFRENGSALRRYLARLVRSTDVAEELAQEAFARVYAVEATSIQSPRSFLFRTAHNLAVNHVRHERTAATESVGDVGDIEGVIESQSSSDLSMPTAEAELAGRQELALLRDAIDHLPAQCKKMFVLRKIDGLSYREIADRLELSVSSVEKGIARAMRLCHERLEQACEPRVTTALHCKIHKRNGHDE